MRPICATIDLSAIAHNLARARAFAGANTRVQAVVKANAYGHGLARVFPALETADALAVIELENAQHLRALGWTREINVLEGFYAPDEISIFSAQNFSAVIHSGEQIAMLEAARVAAPVDVYLKINTGMNRLGFPLSEMANAYTRLKTCRNVREVTIMTHFARADEAGGLDAPLARFQAQLQQLRLSIPAAQKLPISVANSAATASSPLPVLAATQSIVRPGIMLYGGSPLAGHTAAALNLRPAMQLASKIIAIQNVAAGEAVGYGGGFVCQRPTRIAVVAGGYADGYPRHAKSGTPVWVAGQIAPLAGRVSMDKITVDVTDIPAAQFGSDVELWGARVPVDVVAEFAKTISYELLTALAARVPVQVGEFGGDQSQA